MSESPVLLTPLPAMSAFPTAACAEAAIAGMHQCPRASVTLVSAVAAVAAAVGSAEGSAEGFQAAAEARTGKGRRRCVWMPSACWSSSASWRTSSAGGAPRTRGTVSRAGGKEAGAARRPPSGAGLRVAAVAAAGPSVLDRRSCWDSSDPRRDFLQAVPYFVCVRETLHPQLANRTVSRETERESENRTVVPANKRLIGRSHKDCWSST
mmetsp:Transcript_18239/g.54890  ORF Transcript_18239/g.54890 Transcript_18239/m.54890 type:complete len:209 (+) Transcript_18239:1210-1836(+)